MYTVVRKQFSLYEERAAMSAMKMLMDAISLRASMPHVDGPRYSGNFALMRCMFAHSLLAQAGQAMEIQIAPLLVEALEFGDISVSGAIGSYGEPAGLLAESCCRYIAYAPEDLSRVFEDLKERVVAFGPGAITVRVAMAIASLQDVAGDPVPKAAYDQALDWLSIARDYQSSLPSSFYPTLRGALSKAEKKFS